MVDEKLPFSEEMGRILTVPLEGETKTSYLEYAMSVIVGRALPDARDGLKPVHTRILYAMLREGLYPDRRFIKSAGVVGEVIKKYHPHGDAAVYDALVRMVQDFSMRYPLVEGHGNFGSVDGDPPAAYRYTEVRLSKIAMEMLADIEKETVDFRPNFDGSTEEPVWLPSKLPQLLMNGSLGLAVGMATNIPPHNLGELVDALLLLQDHPEVSVDDLMTKIPGPDFPTGGVIVGRDKVSQSYRQGKGKITLRAKVEVEEDKKHPRIVVTEIPFLIRKADIVEQIASLIKDRRLEGIEDLRDETDKSGIRIVLELESRPNVPLLLHQLFRLTPLEVTLNVTFLALVKGVPRILNLKQALEVFLEHRRECIHRRTKFELREARNREHILQGLHIALHHIDEVIQVIKRSPSTEEARARLIKKFSLTEIQAKAILDMRLATLTRLETDKIQTEIQEIQKKIQSLEEILNSPERLNQLISEELKEIKRKYADPRRTRFEEPEEVDLSQLIPHEQVVVTITKKGYIKRVPLEAYKTYGKGGKGLIGLELTKGDSVHDLCIAWTTDPLYIFTWAGKMYSLDTHTVYDSDRYGRGRPIINLLKGVGEEDVAMLKASVENKPYLVLLSQRGKVKKLDFPPLLPLRRSGKQVMKVRPGDRLLESFWVDEQDRIFIVTRKGRGILFSVGQVRTMGRMAAGVRGIRLAPDDSIAGACVLSKSENLLLITQKGYAKRLPAKFIREYAHRGGKGVIVYRLSEKTGDIIGVRNILSEEELVTITTQGKVMRQRIKGIATQARYARGVKAVTLEPDDLLENFDLL